MAEYRLEELADVTGISVRNIRAYRERGLLDAPSRAGRASVYDGHHVAQLQTITDLLKRGFSSAHIAEFFTSVRRGKDLADVLGLRGAVLATAPTPSQAQPVDVDPNGPEVRLVCALGLADVVDGRLVFANSDVAAVISGADDPLDYIGALLRVYDAAGSGVEQVAELSARALRESLRARYGVECTPQGDELAEFVVRLGDYRALAGYVVADLLDAAVERNLVSVADRTGRPSAGSHPGRGGVTSKPLR